MSELLAPSRPVVAESPPLVALRRLDDLLAQAVDAMEFRCAPESAAEAFPGLHVSASQARRLLELPPGRPLLAAPTAREPRPGWGVIGAEHIGWRWLRTRYGLSDLELDVALLALAPEADLRYERLYGYLQDDVGCKRPLVGLALDLLATTAEGRLAARAVFAPQAPLTAHRLLTLVPDPRAVEPPLLAHFMVLDEQITDVLLGQSGLDRRLAGCCRLETPAAGSDPEHEGLVRMASRSPGGRPPRVYAQGPAGSARGDPARDLAAGLGVALLTVETSGLPDEADAASDVLALAFREASLLGALLRIDDIEGFRLRPDEREVRERALAALLAGHDGPVVVEGAGEWAPLDRRALGFLTVPVAPYGVAARRALWERELAAQGVRADPADLRAVADRFRLGPDRIADAALTAVAEAARRTTPGRPCPRNTSDTSGAPARPSRPGASGAPGAPDAPTREELFASARAQSRHRLAALAQRVETVYGWDDLVLPPDCAAQLAEVCERVAHGRQVMDDWGFEHTLSRGRGVSALFTGPPGTGKTMAAEVIARELGLDLVKIDLSTVVSKYVGETEKNLERVFTAAADTDAVLLFDEADALFGKRSEVREAHDRYANIEIAYLLQRMERYEGLAVLTTNLRRNLDEAFTRRLQFIVEFPFPGEGDRERIWRVCFPPRAPRDPALDFARLARDFQLTGGSIRNVVLHAAFLAASDGTAIGMPQLIRATRREFQKLDQVMPGAGPDAGGEG
ncbi:ATP-dependent zinc metalloprotease FtsH [Streptomyces sp. ADI91-18]|uniref:AAA family ATPase n=1 Tax=Streptomyces sp. ADI91-18 TaxID=1522755 RepID=UPI000F554493|nr:AAA family ATPase [Streptomyces sp. ADI91-18]RPK33040.1 ATP-dependent zinc metalloprotease FtsH [Streptomyces sp. ADI91-18]